MTYRAVVFDLDGTLLDTLDDIADACNAALAKHHLPVHPVAAYKYFVGDGVPNLMLRTIPKDRHQPQTLAAVAASYRDEYKARWNAKSRPYAGVPEMLDALTARGIPLAVLSNKPDDFTQRCVTKLLPKWTFAKVMGASPAFPHKPNPASAIHLAGTLGVATSQVVYLGDTSTDMQTATGAGMYAVGVLWGFRQADELLAAGAQRLIARPEDVLAMF